jgi:hypothetical protein
MEINIFPNKISYEQECIICLNNKEHIIIYPCEHKNICKECFDKLLSKKCPICRSDVTKICHDNIIIEINNSNSSNNIPNFCFDYRCNCCNCCNCCDCCNCDNDSNILCNFFEVLLIVIFIYIGAIFSYLYNAINCQFEEIYHNIFVSKIVSGVLILWFSYFSTMEKYKKNLIFLVLFCILIVYDSGSLIFTIIFSKCETNYGRYFTGTLFFTIFCSISIKAIYELIKIYYRAIFNN